MYNDSKQWLAYVDDIERLYIRVRTADGINVNTLIKSLVHIGKRYNEHTVSLNQSAIKNIRRVCQERTIINTGMTEKEHTGDDFLLKGRLLRILIDIPNQVTDRIIDTAPHSHPDMSHIEHKNQIAKRSLDEIIPLHILITIVTFGVTEVVTFLFMSISSLFTTLLQGIAASMPLVTIITAIWELPISKRVIIIRVFSTISIMTMLLAVAASLF